MELPETGRVVRKAERRKRKGREKEENRKNVEVVEVTHKVTQGHQWKNNALHLHQHIQRVDARCA